MLQNWFKFQVGVSPSLLLLRRGSMCFSGCRGGLAVRCKQIAAVHPPLHLTSPVSQPKAFSHAPARLSRGVSSAPPGGRRWEPGGTRRPSAFFKRVRVD